MYNSITIVGNLGKDPETRTTPQGHSVTTFSVATTETYKQEKKTTWHRVITWNKLAEICQEYLVKGKLVLIEGRQEHRQYDDKDGNKRSISEIIARSMKMLGSKPSNSPTTAQNQRVSDDNPQQVITPDNTNTGVVGGDSSAPPF